MLRFFQRLLVATLFVVFAGCAGGGCSSGCSCGGITPLPEGFSPEKRIENSASVRVTDTGIQFLQSNIGMLAGQLLGDAESANAGIVIFPIDESSSTIEDPLFGADVGEFIICPGGPDEENFKCTFEIDLANAQLTVKSEAPHHVRITGPLPVRLQTLPIDYTLIGIPGETDVQLNGDGTCGPNMSFAHVDINVLVSIEIDPDDTHARYGYSRIRIVELEIDEDGLTSAVEFCDNGLDDLLLNALKGQLFPLFAGDLLSTLTGELDEALCQTANPDLDPTCPVGTFDVDGVCRYGDTSDAECASVILGMDGNIDLGSFLAAFSPGTRGALDFLFAAGGHSARDDMSGFAWGDLNPVNGGISLGFYGGTEPTPISGCVPAVPVTLPTNIPYPNELVENTVPNWPSDIEGPHFGFALSERFLNYALAQAYNSGALCLGITGDTIPELSTALLSVGLGAPSMKELSRLQQAAQVAIVIRPQAPPVVTVGNGTDLTADPLLRIEMDQLSFDFYVWSLDRFVRAMTATFDIEVPLNLTVTPGGLVPVIEDLIVANGSVTNSELLREDPDKIAGALQGLMGSLVGGLLGSALPPIDLNAQLADFGIQLEIPPTVDGQGSPGLRKLSKGNDDFLGIFATLGLADSMALANLTPDTDAELIELNVDPDGLWAATFDGNNGPQAVVRLGSDVDGVQNVEWQYKLDHLPWHPWTQKRTLVIDDDWLRVQAEHTVYVRSRIVGEPFTLDPTPAELSFRVDVVAPAIQIDEDPAGEVDIRVRDMVSAPTNTKARVRLGKTESDGVDWYDWSAWVGSTELTRFAPLDADVVEVEAVDEEGNIGTVRQPLIRGKGTGAGGCECTTPAASSPGKSGWAWLASLMVLGLALVRRSWRQRSACDRDRSGVLLRAAAALGVIIASGSTAGCSCGDEGQTGTVTGCRARGDCQVLLPGLVGAYSSAGVSPEGDLWVSGYLEANIEDAWSYGDLVVGRYDGERVDWVAVDGVPSEPAVDPEIYDPTGFRGGQTEAGDDVGLWTSLAFDDAGNPAVAYWDATNAALRYAHNSGGAWTTTEVQRTEGGDVGRYAKLLFVGGNPVISYHFTEPGSGGLFNSGVRVASGSGAGAGSVTWSFDDVMVDGATPCRSYLCPTATKCLISGQCADLSKDCAEECDSGTSCVVEGGSASCQEVNAAIEAYPTALGLYVSAAQRSAGGFGLAFYDRINGNLIAATKTGDAWSTVIADGETGGEDNGDKGIASSLAIDADGHYHIAYVDGLTESLNYIQVTDGTTPGTPEIIDDGLGIGGQAFSDGQHIVGDDAHLVIDQSGQIRVSYQDATAGKLRYAVGSPAGASHEWSVTSVEQEGFAGFFSRQVELDGAAKIVNWWRVPSPFTVGDVAVVSP